jgi:hypothetical protein
MTPALPMGERRLRHVAVSWAACKQTTAACRYLCISWCRDESARVTLELIRGRDASGAAFGGGPVILILHSYFAFLFCILILHSYFAFLFCILILRGNRAICARSGEVFKARSQHQHYRIALLQPSRQSVPIVGLRWPRPPIGPVPRARCFDSARARQVKTVDSENTRPVS